MGFSFTRMGLPHFIITHKEGSQQMCEFTDESMLILMKLYYSFPFRAILFCLFGPFSPPPLL